MEHDFWSCVPRAHLDLEKHEHEVKLGILYSRQDDSCKTYVLFNSQQELGLGRLSTQGLVLSSKFMDSDLYALPL